MHVQDVPFGAGSVSEIHKLTPISDSLRKVTGYWGCSAGTQLRK